MEFGHRLEPALQQAPKRRIRDALSWAIDGFPGCRPVALDSKKLAAVINEDHFVYAPPAGQRALLYVSGTHEHQKAYLVTEDWDARLIDLHLPMARDGRPRETLLDGVLVVGSADKRLEFVVTDAVLVNGNSVARRPLTGRLGFVDQDIVKPLSADTELAVRLPMRISIIPMQRSYAVPSLLSAANEGLIFVPVRIPYTAGQCSRRYRWHKDAWSADFLISVSVTPHYELHARAQDGPITFFDWAVVDPSMTDEWAARPPLGRVARCVFEPNASLTEPLFEGPAVDETMFDATSKRRGVWRVQQLLPRWADPCFREDLDSLMRAAAHSPDLVRAADAMRSAWKAREAAAKKRTLNRYEDAQLEGGEERKAKFMRLSGASAHGSEHSDHSHAGDAGFAAKNELKDKQLEMQFERGLHHEPGRGLGTEDAASTDDADTAESQYYVDVPRDQS